MENLDSIAFGALLISGFAVLFTIFSGAQSRKENRLFANLSTILNVEASLSNVTSAFRFHGITEEDLKRCEITAKEFAYLLASFTAGGQWHRFGIRKAKVFKKDSYRYKMLQNESTRKAWPLLDKMMSPSKYKQSIAMTIDYIEKAQQNKTEVLTTEVAPQ